MPWETKRLSKPVTIMQFVNLMEKFIGEAQAHIAIAEYLGRGRLMKRVEYRSSIAATQRFTEKTLAGSLGAAASGAIVESFLLTWGLKNGAGLRYIQHRTCRAVRKPRSSLSALSCFNTDEPEQIKKFFHDNGKIYCPVHQY